MLKLPTLTLAALLFTAASVKSQLTISAGSTFNIQASGVVTVEGDITGSADITGAGKIVLSGNTVAQNVTMNGFTISNLEMDNPFNANLTGNTRVGSSLSFLQGKILSGNFNLNLAPATSSTGMGVSKFVETNGTGQVIQELTGQVTAAVIPVGAGTTYRPAFLTTPAGTYTGANVGVKVLGVANPNRPPSMSDYIGAYWPVTKTGTIGTGTVTLAGQYVDPTDVTFGSETRLSGYYFTGTDWSSVGSSLDVASNRASAPITAATGELYAMDKFNLINARALLQGAYNTGGLMFDNLRTSPSLIPNADPYRSVPYNTAFTHVANSINENAPAAVFNDLANNNNIVDWVFLQLRNGSTVLQTRSALIQKDGDIVDVDGVSPVTFNNIASGNYTIAVRHRNHLGLSTDPASYIPSFGETKSTAALVDFSTRPDSDIFGTAGTAYATTGGFNLLWAGNAFIDIITAYSGPNNDKDYILSAGLGGNASATVTGYNVSDINMNRTVTYSGPGNDKDFLLATPLSGVSTATRTQQLP